jgi:hypothetical protein
MLQEQLQVQDESQIQTFQIEIQKHNREGGE